MAKLVVEVNGQQYAGWQKIRVRRSLEELADAFTIEHMDQSGADPFPIQEGDAVKVLIERDSDLPIPAAIFGGPDSDLVLTGYVDEAVQAYDSQSHTMRLTGRSRTGDLVDCAAVYKNRQINGKTLPELAKLLVEPFDGISVKVDPIVLINFFDPIHDEIRRFTLQPGESVEQALLRVAKKLGLLLNTTAGGDLLITRGSAAQSVKTRLVEGVNIKRASYHGSWKHRFSNYIFRSQTATDDDWNGELAGRIKGSVADDDIDRYRPMEVVSEHQGTTRELERRATWERNARAGKGQRLSLTVPGWEHADGLWEPNTLVPVEIPFLRVEDTMVIASVEFIRSKAEGTISRLELVGQGAFDILGAPPKLRKRRRHGGLLGKLKAAL